MLERGSVVWTLSASEAHVFPVHHTCTATELHWSDVAPGGSSRNCMTGCLPFLGEPCRGWRSPQSPSLCFHKTLHSLIDTHDSSEPLPHFLLKPNTRENLSVSRVSRSRTRPLRLGWRLGSSRWSRKLTVSVPLGPQEEPSGEPLQGGRVPSGVSPSVAE